MTYRNQIVLGRIFRIHGYEGVVVIRLEKAYYDNIPRMESVFIEIEGRPVPFFISESEYQGGDTLKLRFEGYNSFEKVSDLYGCRIFLAGNTEAPDPVPEKETIMGFRVLMKNKVIGTITDIIQNPGQDLLRILSPENKEVLIPLHEDFIVKTDSRSKTIIMDLPEGLIGLNL